MGGTRLQAKLREGRGSQPSVQDTPFRASSPVPVCTSPVPMSPTWDTGTYHFHIPTRFFSLQRFIYFCIMCMGVCLQVRLHHKYWGPRRPGDGTGTCGTELQVVRSLHAGARN